MKAIETSATFDEKGEMTIDNPPRILEAISKIPFWKNIVFEDELGGV